MKIISKILTNGYTTLVSAVLAVIVGIVFPAVGNSLKPFSDMFLTLISISVIPIIFSSVTCSIIKMITSKLNEITVSKIIFTFIGALVFSGIIGLVVGMVSNLGSSVKDSEVVSNMIFQDVQKSIAELSIYEPLSSLKKFSFSDFLSSLLPKNPFAAFADGNIIQILSISILVGVAVAHLEVPKQEMTLRYLGVLMQSFKRVLKIPTKILPIGMFLLLSSNLSKIKINDLLAMKYFCLSALTCFAVIILAALLILFIYSPIGIKQSLKSLKETIIVAFSTCSNQATLPFLTVTLREKFKLPEQGVDLAIPLGITMCRVSNVAYYAFVSIFIASIYNEPLSIYEYGFVVFGAIVTSFAASGASGVIAISMISIILDPLNLPMESILVVLVAVDPIIDPFRTVTSLIMNAAVSCFIINKNRRKVSCA